MIGQLSTVVLDSSDPHRLAGFYSELLGIPITHADGGWIDLGEAGGVQLAIQHAPELQPSRWPDPAYPQQLHLDVTVADIEVAERRVLALGATRLSGGSAAEEAAGERPPSSSGFRVYADPDGHPFCLCWE